LNWQKENFKILKDNGNCRFVTPYRDLYNDNLELSVEEKIGELIKITDNGRTVSVLYHFGISLGVYAKKNSNMQKRLKEILDNFGLDIDKNEIFTACKFDKFPEHFHNIINAIIEIFQLVNLAQPLIFEKDFNDQVHDFFSFKKITYFQREYSVSSDVKTFKIDYYFKNSKDIFLDTLHVYKPRPGLWESTAMQEAYKWIKLKDVRDFIPSAIYDNSKEEWSRDSLKILEDQSPGVFSWKERYDFIKFLKKAS
jgi:hypothetical protein